ncbi:hypothetical protein LVD17_11540 [Fulvivirga ulvae]|uniref:hypothetical protein n=1 Tax=Fulvivirga ulvae TaxID=2904245 RepID=UPI001F3AE255|nr:hypothetical protein [Fulvivirga ulvae]UII34441.1 hypothetical protein LVD17_11540 [Fulvivirga ulvae]
MRKLYLSFIVVMLSSSAWAPLKITGEIRPGSEFRNGFKCLHIEGDTPAFFVEQRSRLYFDFSNEKLSLCISVQDARLWDVTGQIYKSDNSFFGLYEAWGQYNLDEKFCITEVGI